MKPVISMSFAAGKKRNSPLGLLGEVLLRSVYDLLHNPDVMLRSRADGLRKRLRLRENRLPRVTLRIEELLSERVELGETARLFVQPALRRALGAALLVQELDEAFFRARAVVVNGRFCSARSAMSVMSLWVITLW